MFQECSQAKRLLQQALESIFLMRREVAVFQRLLAERQPSIAKLPALQDCRQLTDFDPLHRPLAFQVRKPTMTDLKQPS